MASLKKLASETAIYGMSTIVGRLLNYFLVPLHTRIFSPSEYGISIELLSYVAFFTVVLTYGMETAFFRFCQKENPHKVFSTSFISILISSLVFFALVFGFASPIAQILNYPNNAYYIKIFAGTLALDAIASIPFAMLRQLKRPYKFALIKNINIGLNIALNLYFLVLCPYMQQHYPGSFILQSYNPTIGIGYIFYAQLAASFVTVPMLWKEVLGFKYGFDKRLWKEQFLYAFPILIVGLAGMINETFSRVMFKFLMPNKQTAMNDLGIFGANIRFAVLMNLFIQAFRYAAEPFFFSQSKNADKDKTYARVMHYFSIACMLIFLVVTLFINQLKGFIGPSYHKGLGIVPILLLGNIFLGIYYNLSIWYKLSDKTKYGAYISLFGAVLTIVLNFVLIPAFGYNGAAWVSLITYFCIAAISYWLGQKLYPIPYGIKPFLAYFLFTLSIFFLHRFLFSVISNSAIMISIQALLFLGFVLTIFIIEKKKKFNI